MKFDQIVKASQKLVFDNSPVILTGIGVAGVVGTAILVGKASFKASDILQEAQYEKAARLAQGDDESEPTLKGQFLTVWTLYIPAATMAGMTISCIILANRIGTRRAAAVAAAYALTEKAFEEYKEKVVEKIGAKKELAVRDDIQQDRVNAAPVSSREVIIAGSGDVLCFESMTGRYFKSSIEEIKKAQNDTNYQLMHDNYVSLTDFYQRIGLPRTTMSDDMGWNLDMMLEVEFSTCMSEDGTTPCIAINYVTVPIRGYSRIH